MTRSLQPGTVTAVLDRHAATRDLTAERLLLELDAAGFWPPGWPLARRVAHQRRLLRARMTTLGVPHVLLHAAERAQAGGGARGSRRSRGSTQDRQDGARTANPGAGRSRLGR